ncbi:MAG TPA: DUF2442 domain-containing protein [Candidatus Saccharimonadales bacterium]|nr:DUF2442 domain-containing protein [Candidatus Saccharimonadales bacterium]
MKAQATEYLEITDAKHIGRYRISLQFKDGTQRVMDFGPFLRQAGNPEITAFRNPKKFKSFHLHYGNLMWGDYEMIFPIADLYRGEI